MQMLGVMLQRMISLGVSLPQKQLTAVLGVKLNLLLQRNLPLH
jgi:hypothetical protein